MTSSTVPDHGPDRLGPTRRRVLAHLQELPDPTSTEVLADSLALHPNTVRFHLDGLLAANLVRRVVEHRGVQGRPRVLFTAAPTVPPVTTPPDPCRLQVCPTTPPVIEPCRQDCDPPEVTTTTVAPPETTQPPVVTTEPPHTDPVPPVVIYVDPPVVAHPTFTG